MKVSSAAHGVPAVQRSTTDDAWACRWSLREVCTTTTAGAAARAPWLPDQPPATHVFARYT